MCNRQKYSTRFCSAFARERRSDAALPSRFQGLAILRFRDDSGAVPGMHVVCKNGSELCRLYPRREHLTRCFCWLE